jgi:hypothetical protein
MPFLVLLTMAQVILSGGVVSLVGKAGLQQLAYIAPSRWGFGAVASTVNLKRAWPSWADGYRPIIRSSAAIAPSRPSAGGAPAEGLSTRHPFGPCWTGLRPADRAVGGVSG